MSTSATPTNQANQQATGAAAFTHLTLSIDGMHCAGCVSRVEKALVGVSGVRQARVNLVTGEASVEYDPSRASAGQIVGAANAIGFTAETIADGNMWVSRLGDRSTQEVRLWRRRFLAGMILATPLVLLVHGLHSVSAPSLLVSLGLATVLQAWVGMPYLVGAIRQLGHGAANMDTLIALGTTTAYAGGWFHTVQFLRSHDAMHDMHAGVMYFADAGMILAFVTLGKLLEAKAKGRASQAIERLLRLAPDEANVVFDGQPRRVAVAGVLTGDIIVIRPGEKVPLDAVVQSGSSSVNEAWLTGEAMPVDKQPGDTIYAGTINGAGALTAQVAHPAGKTALAQVVELVRRAQESRTEIGRVADSVVAWFVPIVLGLAALSLVAWVATAGDWAAAISAAVAVLVVACPCAVGLATPTAILVGSGRGAEMGILIKDARALEAAGKLTAVVFDKTGTVTCGKPTVVAVLPEPDVGRERLLATAAAAERLSQHPVAQAVVSASEAERLTIPLAESLEVVPGAGVRAMCRGKSIGVGNERLLVDKVATAHTAEELARLRLLGQTPLLVVEDGKLLGIVAVADPVAPHSQSAVAELRAMGLQVHLLSGDHRTTVASVARELGINQFSAEVRPSEKQAAVRGLQQSGAVVAMVGDGINDAPALAAADLGIAVGGGSEIAIEAADIVLLGADMRAVARAIALSRMTLRTIYQNLGWALIYNITLLPLAAGLFVPAFGWRLPPAAAAAAMALSSVSVVLNSLWLRHRRLRCGA